MSVIPASHLDILDSTALAYMATIGQQGAPQVSAVWFLWDGNALRFSMKKARQKYRNLLEEPRIAVALTDPANPYRALEVRGTVRFEDDLDLHLAHALSQKYLQRDATFEEVGDPQDRIVIIVEPERAIIFPGQSDPQADPRQP